LQLSVVSVVSSKPFAQVVAALEAAVGHPDMREFGRNVGAARNPGRNWKQVIHAAIGPSGFMEFTRFNMGQILSEGAQGAGAPQMLRFVIGNPLIMKQMAEHVPDAGFLCARHRPY
jgi:hypothetical protein